MSTGGGEEQVKPKSLLALRPAKMILKGWRGLNKERERQSGEGRGMKYGTDAIAHWRGTCVRREQKWAGQEGCVSSGLSVRVLAGDQRPAQLSVVASLRRLSEGLLYRYM